jgi:hypothetical protein
MATTVRRIAGSRLATTAAVAEFMRRRFGDKILGRRAALEALDEPGAPSSEPVSLKPSDLELLDPSSLPTLVGDLPPLVPTLQPPPVQPLPPVTAPPVKDAPVARVTLAKKPALILETQELQEPPQLPASAARRASSVTPSPAISVTPSPQQVQPQKSLPPPTIVPENAAPMLEAYRRQMPTFPTFEERVPPRRRTTLQGIVIAGAIAATFVLGWWLGRTYAPSPEIASCPSATTLAATRVAPTPAPTTMVTSIPTATASTASTAAPAAASSTPVASASALPAATPVPIAIPTTTAGTMATPAPHPTTAPAVTTAVVAPKPVPTVAPKPSATHGGFVPEEL